MSKLKYIKSSDFKGIIIFPDWFTHSEFKHFNPISAGFCWIDTQNESVVCYGKSISLGLESDINDSKIATKQYFNKED